MGRYRRQDPRRRRLTLFLARPPSSPFSDFGQFLDGQKSGGYNEAVVKRPHRLVRRWTSFAFGLALAVGSVMGARPALALEPEFQLWTDLTLREGRNLPNGQPRTGPSIWLDLAARRTRVGTDAVIRAGMGWRVDQEWAGHIGCGWLPTLFDGGGSFTETQAWQHVLWTPRVIDPLFYKMRFRFEQRFADRGADVGLRLRGLARIEARLPNVVYLILWNEFFWNFNDTDWGPRFGADENRAFAGFGLRTNDGFRTEVGYQNVIRARQADQDLLIHSIRVSIFADL